MSDTAMIRARRRRGKRHVNRKKLLLTALAETKSQQPCVDCGQFLAPRKNPICRYCLMEAEHGKPA